MKEASIGCFVFIAVAILLVVGSLGWWGIQVFFADQIGRGNAEIQIQSAPNRIVQYDMFFSYCASVQNAEAGIDAETTRLETTTDPVTKQRIETNISALTQTRAIGINEYNSRGTRDYTSGQFLDSNLPYPLSTEPYIVGGAKTRCGV